MDIFSIHQQRPRTFYQTWRNNDDDISSGKLNRERIRRYVAQMIMLFNVNEGGGWAGPVHLPPGRLIGGRSG